MKKFETLAAQMREAIKDPEKFPEVTPSKSRSKIILPSPEVKTPSFIKEVEDAEEKRWEKFRKLGGIPDDKAITP